jgi:transposase
MKGYKYSVELTPEQENSLLKFTKSKSASARKIQRANILLASNNNANETKAIAEMYHCSTATINDVRKKFCENGLDAALNRKKRLTPPVPAKIDARVEAYVVMIAHSLVPEGRAHWTLQLICDEVKKQKVLLEISTTSVAKILKKTNVSLNTN